MIQRYYSNTDIEYRFNKSVCFYSVPKKFDIALDESGLIIGMIEDVCFFKCTGRCGVRVGGVWYGYQPSWLGHPYDWTDPICSGFLGFRLPTGALN